MTFELFDDSGFLAIVDAASYDGFVDEDWELDELFERFTQETNLQHCIVWSTGLRNLIKVEIRDEPSEHKPIREVSAFVSVTEGKLYLANYTELTMVAQFEDDSIPDEHAKDQYLELDNGDYKVTIRQMYNEDTYPYEGELEPCFELIFDAVTGNETNNLADVIWWAQDR